jgi:two-component system, NarL family, sensor histidine kinase EvgS
MLGQLGSISAAQAGVQSLNLFARSNGESYSVALNELEWRWLRSKSALRLGVAAPDYAPFDMTTNGQDYEGLTADYAGLLGTLLHTRIEVLRYDSRAEEMQALKRGELDMVGTANRSDASDPELALTSAYADDQPTLVIRSGADQVLQPDLANMRLAMLDHYLPISAVRAAYPEATLQLYPSAPSAIGAVAFGQADVYLGDAISANYLANKNYVNDVRVTELPSAHAKHFSFAVASDSSRLLHILDVALAAIPMSEHLAILSRWSAGGMGTSGLHPLHFSAAEQRWLEKHPRLKVAVNESLAPISFFDEHGAFRGISAEVLAKISQRTGLKFDVVRGNSTNRQVKQLKRGDTDLIAAFNPSVERENELRFSRPYLTDPFVLIASSEAGSSVTLDDMVGKKVALWRGSVLHDFISKTFPGIQLIDTTTSVEAMALVAKGEADGAINSLINARYLILREYRDRLRVTSTVGQQSAQLGFATDRGALELYSILDKALQSIPPEEMDELTNRWHNEVVVDGGNWRQNRVAIIQGFAIAALLLLVAAVWIIYLRRLIRTRVRAELALNDQMEFMRVLIDGTPHPIYVRDRQGRLMDCNSAYLDVMGVRRDAVIGRLITDGGGLADSKEAQSYHDEYMKVMSEGEPRIHDRVVARARGRMLTVYHWMLPYRTSDGVVNGMIAGWIDISERQRLFDQLQNAKKSADDANRAKTTFLATMSHEIRTPMNAVIGMLELAMKKADQGVMDRFAIEVASGAARGLLDLIGDILDIARIESGRLSLATERASLRELVESVVRMFDGVARQKGLGLLLDFDLKASRDVLIDPLRFKQILSNLLSNAIKFTDEGAVSLSVHAVPSADGERLSIHVQVKDSGIGISAEDQEQLFSPFAQASNNHQSARGGSGLGLVIGRTLCEMMQGQLHLTSVLGKGTQVDISLDLLTLQPLPAAKLALVELTSQTRTLNILVVDDYPANRSLLSQQLTYLGHGVSDAEDGAHGLRAWRNGDFDVVITDCNMPVMNGYELTQAIRGEEQSSGATPCLILGFTANAQPEEKDRCLAAGMDDCLFKPISLRDLSARLALLPLGGGSLPLDKKVSEAESDIDLSSLQQLARGDVAAVKNLLSDLVVCNEEDRVRLINLFDARDLTGLSDLAHRIKGGVSIIKARRLIQCCQHLEAASAGLDDAALTEAVEAVRLAMERLGQTLTQQIGTYGAVNG